MAPDSPADNAHENRVDSLKPAARKRLDKLMEHGKQQSALGNFDYAHDMYASCVNKDPGNLEYVEAFFDNLQTKYDNNKKGGRGKGNRHDFKKAITDQQWNEAIELGLELLKYNPWDIPTLRPMAEACEALHLNEVELRYLKNALAAKPKDVAINKHCAKSLARMGQFDQAVACWHRIEEFSPSNKPEARQMISQLAMAKTRHATGMTDEELFGEEATEQPAAKTHSRETSARPTPSEKPAAPTAKPVTQPPPAAEPAPEPDEPNQAELEKAIVADPAELSNYMALAKLHQSAGELDDAEEVLTRAQAVSGNALHVQEQLEMIHVLRARHLLTAAERNARANPSDDVATELAQRRDELNRLELDFYNHRSQRYPENNTLKYELAIRLKRVRNYAEAAKYFEEATSEKQLQPLAQLNRGECLQQTRQYRDALACYEAAAQAAGDQEEAKKLALYRAGMLATGLKDADQAIRFFEQLLEIDASFRDAQLRLDKVREMRQN